MELDMKKLSTGKIFFAILIFAMSCAIVFACSGGPSNAQDEGSNAKGEAAAGKPQSTVETPVDPDIASVNAFIDEFQDRYTAQDIEGVGKLFMKDGAVVVDYEGKISSYTTREWLERTANIFKRGDKISDRLTERDITVYRNIAVVKCRFDFASSWEKSYGHDIFSLVRHDDRWLIVSLTYSGDSL